MTAKTMTAIDARAIAKEAYIYGYPMVDNYRILHAYFVDRSHPEYKGPWNQLKNTARVYTHEDTAVQTPNSDTPYSFVGADLRREPLVLALPAIEHDRYFSVQLIDLFTHNFAYLGSRTTGNHGGEYLLAGPRWNGRVPDGLKGVIRCETELACLGYRTQLLSPDDIDNVKRVQAGYQARPLSAFTGEPAPPPAPAIDFITPLSAADQRTSPEFFRILSFVLQFCPTHPSESAVRQRFATLGISPGAPFDPDALSPEVRAAVEAGMRDAWESFDELKKRADRGEVTAADVFGTREALNNNYLYRMAGAVLGIYGNSKAEAMYPYYSVDAGGEPLDGARHRYTLRFAPGQLPPVKAFWSLTMYKMPASLLCANPLNRYLINSPMLPHLRRDGDGGITLLIQHESPGRDNESNWLPAPAGPFAMFMRLYWPAEEALNGTWTQPPLVKAH
jgi:hypothetical protein